MNILADINVIYLLAFANALILLATAAILRGESRHPARETDTSRGGDEALLARLSAQLGTIERRLDAIESLAREAGRLPEPLPVAAGGGARYGEALRLVDGGAQPGDLVSRCGLSRGEADLFVRLHGSRHRGEVSEGRRISRVS